MSISAALKSRKVVFIAAIGAFVAINAVVVLVVYRKNTAPPVVVEDDGTYYGDPAPQGGGGGGGVATTPPVNAAPKLEPVGKEDGVFQDEKHFNIYAGHGVMKVTLPFTGTQATFQYRDLDVPPPDKIDTMLLRYNDATFKAMKEAGVTEDQLKKFRAAKGFPAVYPPETMTNLKAMFSAYDAAPEAGKQAALDRVIAAVRSAGEMYLETLATNLDGRKGAMTPEQYAAYRASLQRVFDEADARAATQKAERDRIAAAERAAAATRAAAAPRPAPVPVDPTKPLPLPYPPPPWEMQGGGVHIP